MPQTILVNHIIVRSGADYHPVDSLKTPRFDAYVKKFTDAGVHVEIRTRMHPIHAAAIGSREAVIIGGQWDQHWLAITCAYGTRSNSECLETSAKMDLRFNVQ